VRVPETVSLPVSTPSRHRVREQDGAYVEECGGDGADFRRECATNDEHRLDSMDVAIDDQRAAIDAGRAG